MERKGECNHCGWCCQHDGIRREVVTAPYGMRHMHPSDVRFYELRGGKLSSDGRTIRYLTMVYAPCSLHDKEAGRCIEYGDRPLTCREFPQTPGQIEGTPCSHWFEDENGAKRGGLGSPHPTSPTFE
jgi:Fe-S-cluster containining protein